jgi:maltooligosyltrehalose trehalohydrolase
MGEEWAASTPWQFFASFPDPELAEAVRTGRRREFGAHGWGESEVPDPMDPATVERSKLLWAEVDKPDHRDVLDLYRSLIALRRAHPELADPRLDEFHAEQMGTVLVLRRGDLRLVCNLGATAVTQSLETDDGWVLLASGDVALVGQAIRLPAESFAIVQATGSSSSQPTSASRSANS